jgi:hypothetical protein
MLGLGNSVCSQYVSSGASYADNYSLSLDGTNDYVDVAVAGLKAAFDPNDFSISCWINTDDSASARVFSALKSSGNQIELMYLGASNKIRAKFKFASSTKNIETSVTPGSWIHVLMSFSSSTGKLSINGGTASTVSQTNAFAGSVLYGPFIGAQPNVGVGVSGSFLEVLVSSLAIYDSDVSANVAEIYNGGTPFDLLTASNTGGNIIAKYEFEEGSGTTALDSSGNSYNGTLVNGATYSTTTP